MATTLRGFYNDVINPSNSFISYLAKAKIIPPKQLKAVAEQIWTAVGVVSALMATISAGNLNSGYITSMDETQTSIFVILSYVSLVLHISCIVIIAIAFTGVEFCMEEDIYAFLEMFGFLGVLPAVLFTFGTILGLLSFLPLIYIISNTVVFYFCVVIVIIVGIFCAYLFETIKAFYWDKGEKYILRKSASRVHPSGTSDSSSDLLDK